MLSASKSTPMIEGAKISVARMIFSASIRELYTAFAAIGVILAAVYLLFMFQKMFLGPEGSIVEEVKQHGHALRDLNWREIVTLAPLVEDGRACLACEDISGIEHILLIEVQILAASGSEWLRSTHHASDLFTAVENERVVLPEAECLVRASFLVRFSETSCRLEPIPAFCIIPCSRSCP